MSETGSIGGNTDYLRALTYLQHLFDQGDVEGSPVSGEEAAELMAALQGGSPQEDQLERARAASAFLDKLKPDWRESAGPQGHPLIAEATPSAVPPLESTPSPWHSGHVVHVLKKPEVVGHVRSEHQEGTEPIITDFWLLEFSGVLAIVIVYETTYSWSIVDPDSHDELLRLIPPIEEEKVIGDPAQFYDFINGSEIDHTSFGHITFFFPFVPGENVEASLQDAEIHVLDDQSLLFKMGYDVGKAEVPAAVPYSQNRMPFPAIQKEMEPTVYSLKNPEVIGFIRLYGLHPQQAVFHDFWLLDFSGMLIIIYLKDGKFSEDSKMHTFLDPERVDEIKELFPPPHKRKQFRNKARTRRVFKEINSFALANSPRPDHPFETNVEERMSMRSPFIQIGVPVTEEFLREFEVHVLGDPTLLERLGYDPEREGTSTVYSEHQDFAHLNFPPFESDFYQRESEFEEGWYTFREGQEIARFKVEYSFAEAVVHVYDFGGISVVATYFEGHEPIIRIGRPEWQYMFGQILAPLLAVPNPDHPEPRTLSPIETGSLSARIGQAFFGDSKSYERQESDLERIIEERVKFERSGEEVVLVVHHRGSLLDRLGYDPAAYPEVSVEVSQEKPVSPEGAGAAGASPTAKSDEIRSGQSLSTSPLGSGSLLGGLAAYSGASAEAGQGKRERAAGARGARAASKGKGDGGIGFSESELVATLQFDAEAEVPAMEYRFLDFFGVLVVFAFERDQPENQTVYLLEARYRTALFDLISEHQRGETPQEVFREAFTQMLKDSSVVLAAVQDGRDLAISADVPAKFNEVSKDPLEEGWQEGHLLIFPGGVKAAKDWGMRGVSDYTVTSLTQPRISGAIRVRTGTRAGEHRLLYFGDFVLMVQLASFDSPIGRVGLVPMGPSVRSEALESLFPKDPSQVHQLNAGELQAMKDGMDEVRDSDSKNGTQFEVESPNSAARYFQNGVSYVIDYRGLVQNGNWGDIQLILSEGTGQAGAIGIDFEKREPITRAQNALIIGSRALKTDHLPPALGTSDRTHFYLIELSGLTFLYAQSMRLTDPVQLFLIPPSLVEKARDALSSTTNDKGSRRMLEKVLGSKQTSRFRLLDVAQGQEIFFGNRTFSLSLPPVTRGENIPSAMGQWELRIFEESDLVAEWGYQEVRESPNFRTYPLDKVHENEEGAFYRAGPLVAYYSKGSATLYFYSQEDLAEIGPLSEITVTEEGVISVNGGRSAHPALVRFRWGNKFVSWDQRPETGRGLPDSVLDALPEAEINLSRPLLPAEDPLEASELRLPLTPELTERTGISSEETYPLVPLSVSKATDESFGPMFRAGPFLIITSPSESAQTAPEGILYFVTNFEAAGISLDEPVSFMGLTKSLAANGDNTAVLFSNATYGHQFVPLSDLHPTQRVELLRQIEEPEGTTAERFMQSEATQKVSGVTLKTFGTGTAAGGILVVQPTDSVARYLLLEEEEKQDSTGVKLSFSPLASAVLGKVQSHQREIDSVTDSSLAVEVVTSNRDYSPNTPFILLDAGTNEESGYEIRFAKLSDSPLKAGQKITIVKGGRTAEYTLRKRSASRFYLLNAEGQRAGTLDVSGRNLSIKIGENFSVSGPLPEKTDINAVVVRGKGGSRELAGVLDRIASRIGTGDELRREASSLLTFPDVDRGQWIIATSQVRITVPHLVGHEWEMSVETNPGVSESLYAEILEAVVEAQRFPPPSAGEVDNGESQETEEGFHPYEEQPLEFSLADDSTMQGALSTRFHDAQLTELTAGWNGQEIDLLSFLGASTWDWGNIEIQGREGVWKEEEVLVEPKRIPYPGELDDGMTLSREYSIILGREKIVFDYDVEELPEDLEIPSWMPKKWVVGYRPRIQSAGWEEQRSYQLPSGEIISFDILLKEDGKFEIKKAQWSEGTQKGVLKPSQTEFQWGDKIKFTWQARTQKGLNRREYEAAINPIPRASDFSVGDTQTTTLPLSLEDATVRIVWEPINDGVRVHAIESVVGSRTREQLRRPTEVSDGYETTFPVTSNVSPFGNVESQVTVSYGSGNFVAASNLDQGEKGGLKWIGSKTEAGYALQHFLLDHDGGHYRPRHAPRGILRAGQEHHLKFNVGSEVVEYHVTYNGEEITATPLTLGEAAAGLGLLGEETVVAYVNRWPTESHQSLPFMESAMALDPSGAGLISLLKGASKDEVLYPTLDSLHAMVAVADRVRAEETLSVPERTLRLRLVGSESPLLFEEVFVFEPENNRWRPVVANGRTLLDDHQTRWNGQDLPTLYRRINGNSHDWVPLPSTTHFQSVPIPGDAGLFVIINASGASRGELVKRRYRAVSGFHRYLRVQDEGIFGNFDKRFAGRPQIDEDEIGQATFTIREEEMTAMGTQRTGRWLQFSAIVDPETGGVTFEDGRTKIVVGDETGTTFEGTFQGLGQAGSNSPVFVQLDVPKGGGGTCLPRPLFPRCRSDVC